MKEENCSDMHKDIQVLQDEYFNLMKLLMCHVCQDRERGVVFLPCRHLVCCLDCAPAMIKCPSCDESVEDTINVILPAVGET
ncbi:putative inhibitor of apoptosis [Crassostrea virginica]